jgi:hypothetical protein
MTVLVGFVSRKHECAFLAADDLESAEKRRIDKIATLGRLAVGFAGADALHLAFQHVAYFETHFRFRNGLRAQPPESPSAVCAAVAELLPRIVMAQRKGWKERIAAGRASPDDLAAFERRSGSMVILDRHDLRLWYAHLHGTLGASDSYAFDIATEDEGMAYRFAINDPKPLGEVTSSIARDPRAWAIRAIDVARHETEQAGFLNVIGPIGGMFLARKGQVEFWSAHESPEAFAEANGFR